MLTDDAVRRTPTRRDVRLWITGTSVSIFGDAALWIVIGIWIKTLTHSDGAAGLAFMAYVLPRFGAPFLGLVVDRVRRRPLIALLNFVLAGWVLLALLVRDSGQVWLLYLVLFGIGLGVGMNNAAGSALLTLLVPKDDLGHTNALMRTLQEGGMLAAPVAGAGLYVEFGARSVILVEAVTFLICATCVLLVRVDEPAPAPPSGHIGQELLAGVRHLIATPRLRAVVLALGGALLGFGFIETLVYTITDQDLHRPAAFVGVLSFAKGIGAVAGGMAGIRVLKRLGPGNEARLTVLGLSLMAIGVAILILPGVVPALIGVVVIGFGSPGAVVGMYTSVQRLSPAHLQGRVAAAASMSATTPQVTAVVLSAILVRQVDYHILLGGMVTLIAASAIYLAVRVTRLDARADLDGGTPGVGPAAAPAEQESMS